MSKTISNVVTARYNLADGSNPLTITATGGVEVANTSIAVYGSLTQVLTVTNAGSVNGSVGIDFQSSGSIANTGRITGSVGLIGHGGTQAVTNSGTIAGSGYGVQFYGGPIGLVTNTAGGVISGTAAYGVMAAEAATITNAGTIIGGTDAIDFTGSFTDRLIVDPGAVFVGAVQGGSGSNTLELAAGTPGQAGTISGLATAFLGFGVLGIDAGATWTVSDAGTFAHGTSMTLTGGRSQDATAGNSGTLVTTGTFGFDGVIEVQAGQAAIEVSHAGLGAVLTNRGIFTNGGTVLVDAGRGGSTSYAAGAPGGTLTNAATFFNDGLIAALGGGGGNFAQPGGGGVLTDSGTLFNKGSITLAGGGGAGDDSSAGGIGAALLVAGWLANDGTITIGVGAKSGTGPDGGGATVTIAASGTLSGTGGIGGGGTLINHGQILSSGTIALAAFFNDGTIAATAHIVDAGSLDNQGSIAATVTLAQGATFTNDGSLATSSDGVVATAASPAVTNDGVITAASDYGIDFSGGGDVTNTGQVTAGFEAIRDYGATQAVTNSGTVFSSRGVVLGNGTGGVVINMAGGTISGAVIGVLSFDENTTVTNAGTITGGETAIEFVGSQTDRLIADPGAVFMGVVQGGSGSNTLELAAGTPGQVGTLTGLVAQFLGFAPITVDAGAAWSLVNAGSIAAATDLVDSGTLSIAGGLSGNVDLDGAGTVSNAGTVAILGALDVATVFNTGSLSAVQSVTGVSLLVNHGSITSTVALARGGAVSNDGTIMAAAGIAAKSGGSIGNSGQIIATDVNESGLLLAGAGLTQTVTNSGTITGGVGVAMYGGSLGLLTNDAGGTIAATSQFGVLVTENATLSNAGTIAGYGLYGAVYFQGTYTDRVIADPGAVFVGSVQGGRGSTALELGAGTPGQAGTITGIGTQFRDFTSLAVDADASWAFDASDTLAAMLAVSNAGTMLFSEAAGTTITVATPLTGAGTLVQAGSGALVLSAGVDNAVTLAGGTLELAGINTAPGYALHFAGAGTLRFDGVHTGTIFGLAAGDTIDLATQAYVAGATATLASGNTLVVQSGAETTDLRLDPAQDFAAVAFTVHPGSGTGLQVSEGIACYARGTRLLTAAGAVAVEALHIGDLMVTASGAHRPVRWIGNRSYDGRFVAGNRDILPIRIHAGALADGVPARDLDVSPRHALFLDGLLVPADALVNGHSIVQRTQVDAVSYFHVELDSHDILLAEGAAAESFVDDDSRLMFQNAASYAALYPAAERPPARYCAPRIAHGAAVERLRASLTARAMPAPAPGPLQGTLDEASHSMIRGWACDGSAADATVRVRILDNGIAIAELDADLLRPDLAAAGFGSGRHGFAFAVPGGLSPGMAHVIEVQRAHDAAPVRGSPWLMSPLDLADAAGPLRGSLDTASRHRLTGWACDGTEPVWLDVLVDDLPVARLVANRYRTDLDQAGIGRGRAGFDVTFPGGLSPLGRHIITVRRARDGAELPGSPIVIAPADSFDADLRHAVIGAVAAIRTREESAGIRAFLQDQIEHLRHREGALPAAPSTEAQPWNADSKKAGRDLRRRASVGWQTV